MRTKTGALVGAFTVSLLLQIAARAQAPLNDTCGGAVGLTNGMSYAMSTTNATNSAGESSCGAQFGKGVWFTFTPAFSGLVVVRTCGSDFQTSLTVYSSNCATLSEPICGYVDTVLCDETTTDHGAVAAFMGTAGVTYRILAGGRFGASGNLQIVASGPLVANDECAGAVPLTAGVAYMTNTAAATTAGESSCGAQFRKGVWFTFTPAFSGLVVVRTCGSDFQTSLTVYSSNCAALSERICGYVDTVLCGESATDNGAVAAFMGTAGVTYRILAGGRFGASGDLQIVTSVSAVGGPAPVQPVYPLVLTKQQGKDSLVFITHGTTFTDPAQAWIETMVSSISNRVSANWQVVGYRWTEYSGSRYNPFDLAWLLYYAQQVGRSVGKEIAAQHWSHVHLVAHSGGAALIQAAIIEINSESPSTVIQATFLDPYLGVWYNNLAQYGIGADWADQYFTSGNVPPEDWPRTGGRLQYAYNVDVTDLNPQRKRLFVFTSGQPLMTCYQPLSTHVWPIDFYIATVTNGLTNSEGLGFPLSKEGGDWQQTLALYGGSRGNEPRILGNQAEICVPGLQFSPTPPTQVVALNRAAISPGGTVQLAVSGFTASSGSPVWVAVSITVTTAVNFVSFDAAFTSASGAAGLLSVYWDANLLGVFDERVILTGLSNYFLSLPSDVVGGDHLLGFRLDPYTNITSSIMVTNAVLGFSGLTEPFSLAVTEAVTNGMRVFALTGTNYNYVLQTSTNLNDWTPIATLVNTNGTVNFVDPAAANSDRRFYRAVAP